MSRQQMWTGTPFSAELRAIAQDELIRRCRAGEEQAYGALYQKYAGMIYRLNIGILQHSEDAEEVLQDTFEYAFRRLDQFDPAKSAFKTWLYQIAISRCRNKRRRKWLPSFSLSVWVETDRDVGDPNAVLPDEVAQLNAEKRRVWQALHQLSPKLRETAILRYDEGLSYKEIGLILDISPKTVESRMRLAHKRLKELLQHE
jgi:RNA polymerase sigma-70 factor (ECF subfamily)